MKSELTLAYSAPATLLEEADRIELSDNAEYWRKMTHAITDLPTTWDRKEREFLYAYAHLGYVQSAADQCHMTRGKARTALRRFIDHITK